MYVYKCVCVQCECVRVCVQYVCVYVRECVYKCALDLLLSTGSVSFCFMLFLKILSLLKGSSWVGNSLTNTTSSSPSVQEI